MNNNEYQPICEAERKLGLSYINLAAHGVKAHLGKRLNESLALVLFGRGNTETIACLWDIHRFESVKGKSMPFSIGELWDWDWRAKLVEETFTELSENISLSPSAQMNI